jgi:hypothetical protein
MKQEIRHEVAKWLAIVFSRDDIRKRGESAGEVQPIDAQLDRRCKIIVIPFDGAGLDRDMRRLVDAEAR